MTLKYWKDMYGKHVVVKKSFIVFVYALRTHIPHKHEWPLSSLDYLELVANNYFHFSRFGQNNDVHS